MTNKSTPKILLCDDEEGIRESLKLILSDHYNLVITTGGAEAIETLKHDKNIGLMMLDIKMPQVNGLDVLKQVKDVRPDLPVIMVTGYKSVETASEASRLGACGYIVKPFESAEILKTVEKNLQEK